jgi:hypothetical protein
MEVTTKKELHNAANRRWRDKDPKHTWAVYAVNRAKDKADKHNIPFDLTFEYVKDICGDMCPVFETEFKFIGNDIDQFQRAALNRIDPKMGYIMGNVAVISLKASSIKSNSTAADLARTLVWLRTIEGDILK